MPCLHFSEFLCVLLSVLSCVPRIGGQVGGPSGCVAVPGDQAWGPICCPPAPLERPHRGSRLHHVPGGADGHRWGCLQGEGEGLTVTGMSHLPRDLTGQVSGDTATAFTVSCFFCLSPACFPSKCDLNVVRITTYRVMHLEGLAVQRPARPSCSACSWWDPAAGPVPTGAEESHRFVTQDEPRPPATPGERGATRRRGPAAFWGHGELPE